MPIIIGEGKNNKKTITTTCKWEENLKRKERKEKEKKKIFRCKYYVRVNRFSGSEEQMIFKRFENVK